MPKHAPVRTQQSVVCQFMCYMQDITSFFTKGSSPAAEEEDSDRIIGEWTRDECARKGDKGEPHYTLFKI